jgi:hypothetical protein
VLESAQSQSVSYGEKEMLKPGRTDSICRKNVDRLSNPHGPLFAALVLDAGQAVETRARTRVFH